MGVNDGLPGGATPLDGEELEGLFPTHLVSRSQLNEWEQNNIESALLWLSRQRRPRPLDERWLRRLHREMFGESRRWAGQYRSSDKSIGVDWRQIPWTRMWSCSLGRRTWCRCRARGQRAWRSTKT